MKEQGGMSKRHPDAGDGTTQHLATTVMVCHCRSNTHQEMGKEQLSKKFNFIF